MKLITDLHIHSKYARGCSNRLDVENIWKTAVIKGIDIIGTGDFTHPKRIEELEEFLCSDGNGFLIPQEKFRKKWIEELIPFINHVVKDKIESGLYPRFILQTEINSVFQRGDKKSRIHNCILIDSMENAKSVLSYLSNFGRVESDGRLAVKQDQCDTLVRLKTHFPQSIFFPAHIWTPYFGVFGSKSGFISMKEAFGESFSLIDGIETGLSSDPVMNRIDPQLDMFTILSNSDAHSPENFAREANIFELNCKSEKGEICYNYKDIEKAIKYRKYDKYRGDLSILERKYLDKLFDDKIMNAFIDATIEFYPQEGKYFGDGHAKCNFLTTPKDTVERNGKCPICGGKITVGVFHRAYDIGNQSIIDEIGFGKKDFWRADEIKEISKKFDRPVFKYIVPLWDIIREVWNAKKGTKKSEKYYNNLVKSLGSEFEILLNTTFENACKFDGGFGKALEKVRTGDIYIKSGFDGIFGIVSINSDKDGDKFDEKNKIIGVQESLF